MVIAKTDPLAHNDTVSVDLLTDRRWVRLPQSSDAAWLAYWTGPALDADQPGVRTIQECLQLVLWDGMSALAPLDQFLPPELAVVPAEDRAPSQLVLAWRAADINPLVRSFVDIARGSFRPSASPSATGP